MRYAQQIADGIDPRTGDTAVLIPPPLPNTVAQGGPVRGGRGSRGGRTGGRVGQRGRGAGRAAATFIPATNEVTINAEVEATNPIPPAPAPQPAPVNLLNVRYTANPVQSLQWFLSEDLDVDIGTRNDEGKRYKTPTTFNWSYAYPHELVRFAAVHDMEKYFHLFFPMDYLANIVVYTNNNILKETGKMNAIKTGDKTLDGWAMWGGNAAHNTVVD